MPKTQWCPIETRSVYLSLREIASINRMLETIEPSTAVEVFESQQAIDGFHRGLSKLAFIEKDAKESTTYLNYRPKAD